MTSLSKSPMLGTGITFYSQGNPDEVMRISSEGVKVNPKFTTDEATDAVIKALDMWVKDLVAKAVETEREACAKVAWDYGWKLVDSDEAQSAAVEITDAIRDRGKQ